MARQFIYNSIPHQALLHANQLTLRAWNDYINILRIQTNDSSTYIETLNKWLFSESSIEENLYEGGFIPYIISSLNELKDSKVDKSTFDLTTHSIRAEIGTKANTVHMEELLALKADVSSVIALQQDKADTTYVDEVARGINQKITQLTNTKANTTYVDTELSKKASTSVVDGVTARVSNLESKDTQHEERLVNLETTKLNSSDFNSYKSVTNNAITLKLEKNLSNIGTLESGVGDSYTVVINDGVNSYKVTIAELKEIFGSLDTEQQLNHYKGVYKKLIDVPAGAEGDYCFIEKITNGDSILTMYVWNKTDNIWEETNTSQYITSTVFSNFKQSIETGSTSVGLARDYTPNDGIGKKFTELETNKQDKLTFDETPTEGSTNPVTSGGLHKILKDGVGGIIDVESLPYTGWKGTAVPCDGVSPVTNIYLNNQLSIEETVSILDKLTYQESFGYLVCFFLVDYINETFLLGAMIKDGKHAIVDQKSQTLYFIEDKSILDAEMEVTFTGWNPDITYPIEVNFIVQYMEDEGLKLNLTDYTPYTSLISTTPFVLEQGDINDKCIYRLRKDELKGTPLPSDTTTVVENLYFNTSLSVDEVVDILAANFPADGNISYITLPGSKDPAGDPTNGFNTYLVGFVKELNTWAIANLAALGILNGIVVEGAKLLFVSNPIPDLGITFTGWNPTITYPIAYNLPAYGSDWINNPPVNGDLISDLVSMRPYKTISTYTYWVFKNKWVQLLTSEDVKTDIVRIYKDADISLGQGLNITLSEFNLMASADTCELITSYTTSAEGGAPVTAKAIYRKVAQLESNGVSVQLSFLCVSIVWFQTTYDNAIITITNENGTITTNYIDQPSQSIEGFDYNNFSIRLRYYDGFEYLYKELPYDEYPSKDSQNLVSSGGVYTELDKKLTKSLSDVSSTTNVAATDNMVINKAGTMYKVTIQELQEVFGSANYKGNFVSVSALPTTGTAGDYAFVKVVTDGDTDLIMYIWNDVDKLWEETGTSQYVKNATFQATMGGVYEALQNVGGIIDVDKLFQDGWSGTPIPDDTTTIVENLYFNQNLSIEEVVKVLENANLQMEDVGYGDLKGYYITYPDSYLGDYGKITYMILYSATYDVWLIANFWAAYSVASGTAISEAQILFSSKTLPDFGILLEGWNTSITMPIEYNNRIYFEKPKIKQNVSLLPIVSSTPFLNSDKNPDEKIVYRLKKENKNIVLGYKGTTVPNSGVLEKIYFNTSLNKAEVNDVLNNLTWVNASNLGQSGFEFYPVLAYMNGSYPYVLAFKKYTEDIGSHSIGDINGAIINFANMETIQDFYIFASGGWQTFTNPYPINATLLSELSGIPLGAQNDLISSLISKTEFKEEYAGKYTYWVFKNKWLQLIDSDNMPEVEGGLEYIDLGEFELKTTTHEGIPYSYKELDKATYNKIFARSDNNNIVIKLKIDVTGFGVPFPYQLYPSMSGLVEVNGNERHFNQYSCISSLEVKDNKFTVESENQQLFVLSGNSLVEGKYVANLSITQIEPFKSDYLYLQSTHEEGQPYIKGTYGNSSQPIPTNAIKLDSVPTQYSKNLIDSGSVYNALQNVKVETDSTPTQDSTNAVQSGGVYAALQNKQNKITIRRNADGSIDITIPIDDDNEPTLVAGLYETGTEHLVTSWEDLLANGMVHVDNGVVYTNFENTSGVNHSSEALTGDLVLPNDGTITSIGDAYYDEEGNPHGRAAFAFCENLTSISIPQSVTTISDDAFAVCMNLSSVDIPNSVTSIGTYALCECPGLTSIVIPDSVTSMGSYVLASCINIINTTLSNNVTSIVAGTFSGCRSLESIVIPSSVTSIGYEAFIWCTSLTSVTIPDSVTSIGESAFTQCTSLTSIVIPNSVTSIEAGAFSACISLASINYNGTKSQWKAISLGAYWDTETGNYIITCTDGTIAKDGTES